MAIKEIIITENPNEVSIVMVGIQGPTGAQGEQGTPGSPGTTDHSNLTNLGADDHPHYLNNARGDARYAPITHNHTASNISDFAAAVRETNLTGLGAGINSPITAADSVLSAFAKLQNQISNFSSVSGTEHAIPFFAANGSVTENLNFFRYENTADNERFYARGRKPDGAFRFEFDGWNGSAYTTGLYLKSTSMAGYAPTHIIMENAAYGSFGSIAVSDHLFSFSHASAGDGNLKFVFYGGYGNIFPFVINAGWSGSAWANPRIKATSYGIAEVVQEFRGYNGQTGNIWEYRKYDNTLITALTASGAIIIIEVDDDADAPNSTFFWNSLDGRLKYKSPIGDVSNIT